jgi:hypothetical protein
MKLACAVGLAVILAAAANPCVEECDVDYRVDILMCDLDLHADLECCDSMFPAGSEPYSENWYCRREAMAMWGACIQIAQWDWEDCVRACPAVPAEPAEPAE